MGVQFDTTFEILLVAATARVEREVPAALEPFGYNVTVLYDGREALEAIRGGSYELVISEVDIRTLSGFELCRVTKRDPHLRIMPFVLVTSFYNMDAKLKGFHVGVDDFLYYPFHELELRARVASLLRNKAFFRRLQLQKEHLDELVQQRTRELDRLNLGLITALEGANRLKDSDTGNHLRRVSEYAAVLAESFGMDDFEITRIRTYSSLHDVGKLGLPDYILKKEGKLTSKEFEIMKRHTTFGYELLKEAGVDAMAQNIAWSHHERWDGAGYPRGLRGNETPLEARVVAIADVFDALSTRRSYKDAMPLTEARERILFLSGRHFDPRLAEVFATLSDAFAQIAAHHSSETLRPTRVMPAVE